MSPLGSTCRSVEKQQFMNRTANCLTRCLLSPSGLRTNSKIMHRQSPYFAFALSFWRWGKRPHLFSCKFAIIFDYPSSFFCCSSFQLIPFLNLKETECAYLVLGHCRTCTSIKNLAVFNENLFLDNSRTHTQLKLSCLIIIIYWC